jgi:hypothetical protein
VSANGQTHCPQGWSDIIGTQIARGTKDGDWDAERAEWDVEWGAWPGAEWAEWDAEWGAWRGAEWAEWGAGVGEWD